MRKPRDYDAELKTLTERAKLLRDRKLVQLGELVVATAADTLPIEVLAGALLAAGHAGDGTKEAWRTGGAAFFQRAKRNTEGDAVFRAGGGQTSAGGAQPAAPNTGTP